LARQAWEEAHQQGGGRVEAARALAALALERGEAEEAARWVREVVESGEDPSELLFPLALELEKDGDARRASIYWRLICEMRPDWPAALVNLGAALLDAGEEQGAREAWHRALEADPRLAREYFA
jgi:Flp pilus assembly protein TadD